MAVDQSQITLLESQVSKYTNEQISAETKAKMLAQQKTELAAECQALGIPVDAAAAKAEAEKENGIAVEKCSEAEKILAGMNAGAAQ